MPRPEVEPATVVYRDSAPANRTTRPGCAGAVLRGQGPSALASSRHHLPNLKIHNKWDRLLPDGTKWVVRGVKGKVALCHSEDICQVIFLCLLRRDVFARILPKEACWETQCVFSRWPLLGNNVLAAMHTHCSFLFP